MGEAEGKIKRGRRASVREERKRKERRRGKRGEVLLP